VTTGGGGGSERQQGEPTTIDEHARDRITDKRDGIVIDRWRNPDDYTESLTGVPYSKLGIGQFRFGAACDHDKRVPDIYTIEHRSGASRADDG